jgi:hypothetical protein
VNWRNGVIVTDAGLTIAFPGMSFDKLVATGAVDLAETTGAGLPNLQCGSIYKRVRIGRMNISGIECCAGMYFTGDNLTKVCIVVTDATADRFSFITGYASPPDGPEVSFLSEWIRRETGHYPPMCFRWGSIGHVYDGKANFARVCFLYQ